MNETAPIKCEVIPLFPREVAPPKCSFCGNTHKKMFDNSGGKYICGSCVVKAASMLK